MREGYVHRETPTFEAQLERRSASEQAAFLVPHLRAGMRLVDLGCGPGSITIGLAGLVQPGEVVGSLPFPDASFDGGFAHMVLMHLAEPARALREARRVLRSGAFMALRDADLRTTVRWPTSPEFERFVELRLRAHEVQGTDGRVGRRHRELLLAAGFGRAETRAITFGAGSADTIPARASWLLAQLDGIGRIAIGHGWLDEAGRDAIAAEIRAWSERPDAVMFTVVCESLGWV